MKEQRDRKSPATSEEKPGGGPAPPDTKAYYKVTGNQVLVRVQKINQQSRRGSKKEHVRRKRDAGLTELAL